MWRARARGVPDAGAFDDAQGAPTALRLLWLRYPAHQPGLVHQWFSSGSVVVASGEDHELADGAHRDLVLAAVRPCRDGHGSPGWWD